MSSFSVTSKKTYGTVQMVFTVNSIFWWNLQNRYIDRWFGKADIKKDECFEFFAERVGCYPYHYDKNFKEHKEKDVVENAWKKLQQN